MIKHLGFGLCLLMTLGLLAAGLPLAAGVERDEPAVYGAGVQLAESTSIAEILADPPAWLGKTVRVEGTVVGVCSKKGCWMELESRDGARLRVQVEDDFIVFPQEAKGAWAVAEGTVEVFELRREQYVGWMRHVAEEKGEELDDTAIGEGPFELVQIAATGARIAE